jgi:hypothetical protein
MPRGPGSTPSAVARGKYHYKQENTDNCVMASIWMVMKNFYASEKSMREIKAASQRHEGGYRPSTRDAVFRVTNFAGHEAGRAIAHQNMASLALAAKAAVEARSGVVVSQMAEGYAGTFMNLNAPEVFRELGVSAAKVAAQMLTPKQAKRLIHTECAAGRPVMATIRWVDNGQDAGGHAIVFHGFDKHYFSDSKFLVFDPGDDDARWVTVPTFDSGCGDYGQCPRYPTADGAFGWLIGELITFRA